MMIKKKSQTGRANLLNLYTNHMEEHLPPYGRTPSDIWNHIFRRVERRMLYLFS